jgi:hypothetical protein
VAPESSVEDLFLKLRLEKESEDLPEDPEKVRAE